MLVKIIGPKICLYFDVGDSKSADEKRFSFWHILWPSCWMFGANKNLRKSRLMGYPIVLKHHQTYVSYSICLKLSEYNTLKPRNILSKFSTFYDNHVGRLKDLKFQPIIYIIDTISLPRYFNVSSQNPIAIGKLRFANWRVSQLTLQTHDFSQMTVFWHSYRFL